MATAVEVSKNRQIWRKDEAALTPLLSTEHAPRFSPLGSRWQPLVNDASSGLRSAIAVPFDSWVASPYYPDTPNTAGFQAIGFTSATNGPIGISNLIGAGESGAHSYTIGDTRAVGYSVLDGTASLAQAAFGFDYGVFRVANIGTVVAPENATWTDLSNATGFWGNVLGAALYLPIAAGEMWKFGESASFASKVAGKGSDKEKIAYLQKRLHADESTLIEKEKKKVVKDDPSLKGQVVAIERIAKRNIAEKARAAAVQEQSGLLKKQIEFMRENGMCGKGFSLEPKELEALVNERLSPSVLEAHGKAILVQRLKEKKVSKLTRRMGADAVKELEKTPDKVELAKIEVSHSKTKWKYFKRGLLYALEGAAFIALCFVTGGAPLWIVLGLSIGLAIGFLFEMKWSIERMRDIRDKSDSAPGNWDEAWPIGSAALAIAAAVTMIVITVGTGGWGALILPLILSSLWIGASGYHYACIQERREKYVDKLLQKDRLQLDEFAFVLANVKPHQIKNDLERDLMPKLSPLDRKSIIPLLDAPKTRETFEEKRRRYQKAAEEWQLEKQKLSLMDLQMRLSQRFGTERFNKA